MFGINKLIKYFAIIIAIIIFITIIMAFIVPLIISFTPIFSAKHSVEIFNKHIFDTTIFTVAISFFSTLIALLIGVSSSFFVANRTFFGKRIITYFSAVPLCIPPLIIALGFVSIFGVNGIINKVLEKLFDKDISLTFLYSPIGIIIVQGFYNFPLIMLIVSNAWKNLSPEQRDAARLLGAKEKRIFFTITIQQLSPAIAASAIPVFLYCFFSFLIVLLFGNVGSSTLEVEIYRAAKVLLDFKTAATLAIIETTCAFTIIIIYNKLKPKNINYKNKITNDTKIIKIANAPFESKAQKITERILFYVLLVLILLFFILPLCGIIIGSVSTNENINIFSKIIFSTSFLKALKGTFLTSPISALLCVIAAFTYACYIKLSEKRENNITLQTIAMLPMAVSSVVLGIGMTALTKKATIVNLVFAQAALAWPFAFRQIYASLSAISKHTIDSAKLLSFSYLDTIFRIMLPFSKKAIFSAYSFCFAISIGDTTLPLILSIQNFDTLSLYTYRLASSYRFAASCACAIIICILSATLFSFSEKNKNNFSII